MKNTHICPKCGSKDIIRLTDHTHGTILPTNVTIFGAVYLSRYLCADCGFMEEWIDDPRDRESLRKKDKPF